MQIERQGLRSEAYTRYLPKVRGGVCDYCGVLDPNVDSKDQYKLCPHFRGQQLMCTYCPDNKNPDEVVGRSILNVHEHPDKPGTWVVVCNSFECSEKHLSRFKLNK